MIAIVKTLQRHKNILHILLLQQLTRDSGVRKTDDKQITVELVLDKIAVTHDKTQSKKIYA